MDLNLAKYFLKRIQTILELHSDGLTNLDKDMVLEDIRRLYDTVRETDSKLIPINKDIEEKSIQKPDVRKETPHAINPGDNGATVVETNAPGAGRTEEPFEEISKPDHFEVSPAPAPEQVQDSQEPYLKDRDFVYPQNKVNQGPVSNGSETRSETGEHRYTETNIFIEETPEEDKDYEDLFDIQIDRDLSGKLGNAKIDNLNAVLSINDKILYINQLFKGEAIPFQEALKKFQSFYTYEEAKKYAGSELVEAFGWENTEKKDIVRTFMKQVHRLY